MRSTAPFPKAVDFSISNAGLSPDWLAQSHCFVIGIIPKKNVASPVENAADQVADTLPVANILDATTSTPAPVAPAAAEQEADTSTDLFGPRANAARSAQQYLAMTGFSRRGLIEQLSSSAGSGYDEADATAAVDSLDVDWNEQTARSAKEYLNMTGFSCSGLIEQLSSDAGSKYTESQARYGAHRAGAC